MDPNVYLWFAKSWLCDLAVRLDQQGRMLGRGRRRQELVAGKTQRVFLRGKHVCHQDAEKKNGKLRFRGSDSAFRLTLAVMACEKWHQAVTTKTRGANWRACFMVAAFLLSSRELPLRSHFLQGRRGRRPKPAPCSPITPRPTPAAESRDRAPRFAELDALISADRQERIPAPTTLRRLARSISSEVRKWRKDNPDYARDFDMWFRTFRFSHWRDTAWYKEAEPLYRERMRVAVTGVGEAAQWTAMMTTNLAILLHEQGKHREALRVYQCAMDRWQIARDVPEARRQAALTLLQQEMRSCEAAARPQRSAITRS
jgi:hypothetical protein